MVEAATVRRLVLAALLVAAMLYALRRDAVVIVAPAANALSVNETNMTTSSMPRTAAPENTSAAAANESGDASASSPSLDVADRPFDPSKDERMRTYDGRIVNIERPMNRTLAGRVCPSERAVGTSRSADAKSLVEHVVKYSRYAQQYCNASGMLQMNVPSSEGVKIIEKIAEMVALRPNTRVLDWGAGCGTMINYFALTRNTTGVGIDVTEPAIRFAQEHAQPGQVFCFMDGTRMQHFPDASFDAVVSWGAVYHLRRMMAQCEVVNHFVRVLKPGGRALVGHIRTDKSQRYWRKQGCGVNGATLQRYRDATTFRQPSWRRHGFFSILVTKHF